MNRYLCIINIILVLLFTPCAICIPHSFQNVAYQDYVIKAGYIYKFLSFVDWPDNAFSDNNTPFTITILGEDPFEHIFDSIKDKTIKNRKINIQRLKTFTHIDQLKNSHILFISPSLEKEVKKLLNKIQSLPILTVSDMNNFNKEGGIIHFIDQKDKIKIQINKTIANKTGIQFRSRLLRIAVSIK